MTLEGHPSECFVCGLLGIDVHVDEGRASAELVLDARVTGPPPFTHGGAISALFDEVLGAAAHDRAPASMTAHLEIDFRRPWPVGEWARMTAQSRQLGEHKLLVTGELSDAEGELFAEARGMWVVPRAARRG